MAYRTTAFGLSLLIDWQIEVPGLTVTASQETSASTTYVRLDAAELQRRWGAIVTEPLRARELRHNEAVVLSVDFAEPAGYLLWAEAFGRVLISADGIELLCEPDPSNSHWTDILAAQALPLAATIRGQEVFHASGVVLHERALLFAGPPGAGKSSLAAALVRDGARLLSDDAVALKLEGDKLIAHAGSVALQLRATEDERLSSAERASHGSESSSSSGKQRYVSQNTPAPAPVAALFLLERSADAPAMERLSAVDPFELIASTFNLSVRTPERLRRQLDVVSTIAERNLAYRLRVQPGIDATALAAQVRAQLPGPTG